jgi:hypothetical protein
LYRVKRIRTKGDYFIIHAERNDSLFKIISKKVQEVRPNLDEIKKGGYYNFICGDPCKQTLEKVEPLTGIANSSHVKYNNYVLMDDGVTKIRFSKRFHNKLCRARNLVGLYYIPVKPR